MSICISLASVNWINWPCTRPSCDWGITCKVRRSSAATKVMNITEMNKLLQWNLIGHQNSARFARPSPHVPGRVAKPRWRIPATTCGKGLATRLDESTKVQTLGATWQCCKHCTEPMWRSCQFTVAIESADCSWLLPQAASEFIQHLCLMKLSYNYVTQLVHNAILLMRT